MQWVDVKKTTLYHVNVFTIAMGESTNHNAGKNMIEIIRQQQRLTDPDSLNRFFRKCNERENGVEPDWEDHRIIRDLYWG